MLHSLEPPRTEVSDFCRTVNYLLRTRPPRRSSYPHTRATIFLKRPRRLAVYLPQYRRLPAKHRRSLYCFDSHFLVPLQRLSFSVRWHSSVKAQPLPFFFLCGCVKGKRGGGDGVMYTLVGTLLYPLPMTMRLLLYNT